MPKYKTSAELKLDSLDLRIILATPKIQKI